MSSLFLLRTTTGPQIKTGHLRGEEEATLSGVLAYFVGESTNLPVVDLQFEACA